jgi:hypothetical protein
MSSIRDRVLTTPGNFLKDFARNYNIPGGISKIPLFRDQTQEFDEMGKFDQKERYDHGYMKVESLIVSRKLLHHLHQGFQQKKSLDLPAPPAPFAAPAPPNKPASGFAPAAPPVAAPPPRRPVRASN